MIDMLPIAHSCITIEASRGHHLSDAAANNITDFGTISDFRKDHLEAQAVDEEEDHRYGTDKRGDELPQELAFREIMPR